MFKHFKSLRGRIIKSGAVSLTLFGSVMLPLAAPMRAMAATTNPSPAAKVSFTFDDGYNSALTQAAPTLAKYGFSGTDYIITNCVGMTTAPNTCRANTDATYMSWDQITQLKNTYGWEIGSHTVTHPYLATFDATDGQPAPLTAAQVTQELIQSKTDLAAHGFNATAFAPPYGDYNPAVLSQIAKYYSSMRGFQDTGYNTWPNNDYLIRDQHIEGNVSVKTVQGYIDTAIKNNQWLVLTFHDIKTKASKVADDYEYSTANLDKIAAYVKSKNVPVVNVSSGLVTSDAGSNLLAANSTFNNGMTGWSTDSPANVTIDSGNNGSYPDPTNSVKLVASSREVHLFSSKVAVDANTTYLLKSYANIAALTSGEFGYYVDEYDGFGNWISGQYKAAARNVWANEINFSYKPTSANVKSASLQVFATANSGITAYFDNAEWFPLQTAVPTPPPTVTNLVPNGTFDAGLSSGWTTDKTTNVTIDNANNGSPANPVNSVKASIASGTAHLFSPRLLVDATKSYNLTTYLNIKQIAGGEVDFYMDEYDANGNWISGQYKPGASAVGAGDVSFSYTPSSANVKQASYQVIIVGGASGTLVYIDDVRWVQL